MILMLEGLDRTGKTTLADALGEKLDAPVIHKGAPNATDALTEYLAPFVGYAPARGQHLVLDRWHWGEMVWPAVFNRPSLMRSRDFRYVDSVLADLGALAVYCTGDTDDIWARCVESDEPITKTTSPYEETPRQLFQLAYDLFEGVAGGSAMRVLTYDFTRWQLDEAVAGLIASARGLERAAKEARVA